MVLILETHGKGKHTYLSNVEGYCDAVLADNLQWRQRTYIECMHTTHKYNKPPLFLPNHIHYVVRESSFQRALGAFT